MCAESISPGEAWFIHKFGLKGRCRLIYAVASV